MKSLGAAIVSALLAVAVAYYGLVELAGLEKATAAHLASAVMAAIPYLRELFEKAFLARHHSRTPVVISIGDFGISPRRMVLYGTLIVVGAMNLGSGVGALSAWYIGVSSDIQWLRVAIIVASLIQFPATVGVGYWVGRRCASHGVTVIFLVTFLARVVTALFDAWLLVRMAAPLDVYGRWSFPSVFSNIIGGTLVFFLFSLLGYWRGRRQRVAAYLFYLLQTVSEDTRKVIVDLAFEEARARPPQARRGSPP